MVVVSRLKLILDHNEAVAAKISSEHIEREGSHRSFLSMELRSMPSTSPSAARFWASQGVKSLASFGQISRISSFLSTPRSCRVAYQSAPFFVN